MISIVVGASSRFQGVQPYCGFSPDEAESAYGDDYSKVLIRGAVGYLYDDFDLFFWTGKSMIHVSTWRSELDPVQAANDLIHISQSVEPDNGPLPAPIATDC
jgi:hypothetical protein